MPEARIGSVACPRCGCWLIRDFKCNCGAVHSDYCENCGRYTAPTLKPNEHVELSEFDTRCITGPMLHSHEK